MTRLLPAVLPALCLVVLSHGAPAQETTPPAPGAPSAPDMPPPAQTPPPADVVPLDAAGFEARTSGRTVTYLSGGQPYGEEQYLPGRRVVWIFAEGECKAGEWFQSGAQICFAYDGEPDLQCWIFADRPEGLTAWFEGDLTRTPLVSSQETKAPLDCRMIGVGV